MLAASRSVTPASRNSPVTYGAGDNPRPLPPTSAPTYVPAQQLHPKKHAPEFRLGSPFAHNDQQGYHRSHVAGSDDEPVSPKSSPMNRNLPAVTSAWTSINRSSRYDSMPPSPPNNENAGPSSINHHHAITASPGFRDAEGQRSTSPSHIPSQKKLDAARASSRWPRPKHKKRSLYVQSDEDFDLRNVVVSSSSSEAEASYSGLRSEMSVDSDLNLVVRSPPPHPPASKVKKSKRSRRVRVEDESEGEDARDTGRVLDTKRLKRSQWTAAD